MPEQSSLQRDLDSLATGVRWRWGIVCIGTVILLLALSLGLSDLSLWIVVSFAATGLLANIALIALLRRQWYRWWLIYACCLIDVLLIGHLVVYLGPGGTIVGFLLVIVPSAFRPNRRLSIFAVSTAVVVYVFAALTHWLLSGNDFTALGPVSKLVIDLVILTAVAATLIGANHALSRRLGEIGTQLARAARGNLEPRAIRVATDDIGRLEQSLNELVERMAGGLEVVRCGAEESAALGSVLKRLSTDALEKSRAVASVTEAFLQQLGEMQVLAEHGQTDCTDASGELKSLQSRAEGNLASGRIVEDAAQLSGDRLTKAIETVTAMEVDFNRARSVVEELSAFSNQIGSSAQSIAKIARHTHVLALNAAIEAAHAEEHGAEFAVVADQVRNLAGEAGRSAREVSDLVVEINAGIAAAASAMTGSEEKVNDISQAAKEARTALNELSAGSSSAGELAEATSEASRSHLSKVKTFAERMSQIATTSEQCSAEIQETSGELAEHIEMLSKLDHASERIADSATQLKRAVAQLSAPKS